MAWLYMQGLHRVLDIVLLCIQNLLNGIRKCFKNGPTDIFDFGDFTFPKTLPYNKNTNKMQTKKDQGNVERRFGDNCLTSHLVKFLQDGIKP